MIHILTANVGRGPASTRRAAVHNVIRHADRATIGTWCELDADERTWATKLRPSATWVGAGTMCPIQVGPAWRIVEQKTTPIYAGRPKFSGPLHLVEVTLCRKWRPWSRAVHVISTHLVANFGRWGGEYEKQQAVEWGEIRGAVADAHGRGLDVLIAGDYNIEHNAPIPKAHRDQVVAYRSGLDAVLAIPAPGRQVKATGRRFVLGVEPQHKGLDVAVSFPPKAPKAR